MGLSTWWAVGWAVGAAVVVIAAVLIVLIASLSRRIANESREIIGGLQGVAGKTTSLHDVTRTHHAVAEITDGLRRARGDSDLAKRPGGIGPDVWTGGQVW